MHRIWLLYPQIPRLWVKLFCVMGFIPSLSPQGISIQCNIVDRILETKGNIEWTKNNNTVFTKHRFSVSLDLCYILSPFRAKTQMQIAVQRSGRTSHWENNFTFLHNISKKSPWISYLTGAI